ncbi:hypothetical protein GCM10009527_092210 [Actinomadura nitritigenes]|uniref:aldo/keto reductase n=1 Tax=Actinomadura nitritigenes TaxID=134602 RepID=UPI00336D5051
MPAQSATASAAVEASLHRLRCDRVDLFWTHVEDRSVPLEEAGQALALLVESGTVGRLGASLAGRAWRARTGSRHQDDHQDDSEDSRSLGGPAGAGRVPAREEVECRNQR